MYLNSDNALLLAKKLEEIPNVAQVRFNYVLRDNLKDELGANAVNYCCMVESLDQSHQDKIGAKVYQKFMIFIAEEQYENTDNHQQIQSVLNERIGHYLRTGEKIDTVGSYSFPYAVDADGNAIPYDLYKSNPPRS